MRVALVGYGFMGKMHTQCYQATGEATIAAVVDVEADRREDAASKFGCKTYTNINDVLNLPDIDVIDICTPTYLHEEMVIAAAKAGKTIMCEKPMSLSVESCDRMIEAVEKAGVTLMIGQVIRFWPEYQVIKELVDSGKYGKVEWLEAKRVSPIATYAWQNWFADPNKSGGAILDLHIHDADYISYLLGTPKKVQAVGVPNSSGAIDSVQTVGWEHPSGAKSSAVASLALAPGFPFNMALLVACEKATIKFDMAADPSLMVYQFDGEPFAPKIPEQKVSQSTEQTGNISSLGGYFNEIQYFVECVKAGKKPEIVTPQAAREAVRICLAERNSIETGKPTEL